jgi:methionine synthase II (cobalamin-independent)
LGRPKALVDARQAYVDGRIDASDLEAAEDRAISDVLEL